MHFYEIIHYSQFVYFQLYKNVRCIMFSDRIYTSTLMLVKLVNPIIKWQKILSQSYDQKLFELVAV